MQKKITEHRGTMSQSVSAPNVSNYDDHTGRKVNDWTEELVGEEDANMLCGEIPTSHPHGATESHRNGPGADQDSLMSEQGEEDDQRHEVQS